MIYIDSPTTLAKPLLYFVRETKNTTNLNVDYSIVTDAKELPG
jgi:hypothetical protein